MNLERLALASPCFACYYNRGRFSSYKVVYVRDCVLICIITLDPTYGLGRVFMLSLNSSCWLVNPDIHITINLVSV